MNNELEARKKENEDLSEEYYVLRQQVFAAKTDFNQVFQQQVELEQTFRCLRQVEFHQAKFLRILDEYYKYRNLYYKAEIEDIKLDQQVTEEKIGEIRKEMEGALEIMTSFLDSIVKGSLFKDLKEQEMEVLDKHEELNNSDQQDDSAIEEPDQSDKLSTTQTFNHFKILPPIVNASQSEDSMNSFVPVF